MSNFFVILFFTTSVWAQDKWIPQGFMRQYNNITDTTLVLRINKSLPKFRFRYREYYMSTDSTHGDGETFFRVDIYREDIDTLLQTIKSSSNSTTTPIDYNEYYNNLGFKGILEDYNFDGYKDLRFNYISGMNQYSTNQFYQVYIYNPLLNKFVFNLSLYYLCNPTPFPKEKIIRSYTCVWSAGRAGEVDTYHWVKDSLIELRSDYFEVHDQASLNYLGFDNAYFIHKSEVYHNKVVKKESKLIKGKNILNIYKRYWR